MGYEDGYVDRQKRNYGNVRRPKVKISRNYNKIHSHSRDSPNKTMSNQEPSKKKKTTSGDSAEKSKASVSSAAAEKSSTSGNGSKGQKQYLSLYGMDPGSGSACRQERGLVGMLCVFRGIRRQPDQVPRPGEGFHGLYVGESAVPGQRQVPF